MMYSNGNGVCIVCAGETAPKLTGVKLGCSSGGKTPSPGSRAAALLDLISDFIQGKPVSLPEDVLELSSLSDFELRVLRTLRHGVPRGKVVSYAALAAMSGTPGGARAVGGVMRRNLFPLFFPCHRVIAGNGAVGGFMGEKDGGGPALKKLLLLNEGVVFVKTGKVAAESIIRI